MGGFSGDLCLGMGEPGGRPKPPPVGEVPSVARRKGREEIPPPSGGGSLCPRRQRDQNAAGGGPRWTGAHRGLTPGPPFYGGRTTWGLEGRSGARGQAAAG